MRSVHRLRDRKLGKYTSSPFALRMVVVTFSKLDLICSANHGSCLSARSIEKSHLTSPVLLCPALSFQKTNHRGSIEPCASGGFSHKTRVAGRLGRATALSAPENPTFPLLAG